MSSKIGLILSMLFVSLFFMFGADTLGLQRAYSELDSISVSVAYEMSQGNLLNKKYLLFLGKKYNVSIIYDGEINPAFGEDIFFKVQKPYKPMIISKSDLTLTVNRTTVIGFYG